MDPETVERIFEPFFINKWEDKGGRLGNLHCVRNCQAERRGNSRQSEPERGATFTIHFPRVREAAAEPTENTGRKYRWPLNDKQAGRGSS